jgi:putative transposase
MPQSLSNIVIHLIFSTKDRQPILQEDVRPDLHRYLAAVLKNMGCPAITIGSQPDHVHVLFNLGKTQSVSDVAEEIKKSSSRWIKTKVDGYRSFSWQRGYGAFSVSESNVAAVRKYIDNQPDHHRWMSFQEELIKFLSLNKIAHDEKYLWE